jgi:hypothetical protein
MATTAIRLSYEASTAIRALNAIAAVEFPRGELNLITHQKRVDTPEARIVWAQTM